MSDSLTKLRPAVGSARLAVAITLLVSATTVAQKPEIPDALIPWQEWATWDDVDRGSPSVYSDAQERIRFWPSRCALRADEDGATWEITVIVFSEAWVPLPGNNEQWPRNVVRDEEPIAVVEREGLPAVQLPAGRHVLSGEFVWDPMPQRIAIPKEIGLLSLVVDDEPIDMPNWDTSGHVWLKRQRMEAAESNSITAKVYRVIEDGIPMWLRTEIELTVSGKSREEELGWVLPDGWKLANVDNPIPVAIDERGRMKAQVRAGKWIVSVLAFRATDTREIKFASDAKPITNLELVGLQLNPEFRLAEISGLQPVDVTQTTFPQRWRSLPVYQWDTAAPMQLEEKMRGMGLQHPSGLEIYRQVWLDQDGRGMTYRDSVSGQMQQLWRLDTADGQELGAVRVDGSGQLITTNPLTGSQGVEIRTRNVSLEATGRIQQATKFPANGWQSDSDSLEVKLNLPPGWRVLVLFGADHVDGDWLTAWSLLDLFLLLIFSVAVFRIWGFRAGVIAFLAFGLAYHEPGSPRVTWLFLLMPVALLRVVRPGTAQQWITVWKYFAVALLVINLIPFLASQIQNALYPQLERPGINYASHGMFWPQLRSHRASVGQVIDNETTEDSISSALGGEFLGEKVLRPHRTRMFETSNLAQDPKARIQTGPALPEWSWNQVVCRWDGPVSSDQTIRPIYISLNQHRVLTVARIALLGLLGALLFRGNLGFLAGMPFFRSRVATATALMILVSFGSDPLQAQAIPDADLLKTLRERLLKPSDAFPSAAEVAAVDLQLTDDKVVMDAEYHTAAEVAVPLPGRIPTWSPVSVNVDGKPAEWVRRRGDYLWTVLPKGVHHVVVESLLPDVAEWEWTFLLKPRRVTIAAPGWNVTGVRRNGVPDEQVSFTRQRAATEGTVAYDRKDFDVIVAVDRHIESGLVWQVRNEVSRLSGKGKATSLNVPLMAGENVLTSNMVVEDGAIQVRLGADQDLFSWVSELPPGNNIHLVAPETEQWVERWHLLTSPVWNVTWTGLHPIFESEQENLIPVWRPWPNEEVTLKFNEPESIAGETITVQRVRHETSLGSRQRTMDLKIELESSLGGDFPVTIDADAVVSSVNVDGQTIPVRRDGKSLIVPVHPGKQSVGISWRTNETLQTVAHSGDVKLPVAAANIESIVQVPESRWVLWAAGPTMGPAVRFWTILVFAVLVALLLGSLPYSPLSRIEWVLLAIGLTQVPIAAAMVVVAWLFLLAWRGRIEPSTTRFNFVQIGLVLITLLSMAILVAAVGAGLLGNPEMFIVGNGSSQTYLRWFQPRADTQLPAPAIVSVSVWYYRLLMLFWALWLSFALLRWLKFGWQSFTHGDSWVHKPIRATAVPTSPPPSFDGGGKQ